MLINLKVKTLDAQTHDFTVDNELTVREFKDKIAEKTNIAADQQRIIFSGRVLPDDKHLREYDVDGMVVHVAERPPPSQRSVVAPTTAGAAATNDEPPAFRPRFTARDMRNATFFHAMDGMVLGTMAFPQGHQAPNGNPLASSSSFCMNRITVARHMLQCADNIAAYLENPTRGLNNTSLDILASGRWTVESTVVEVGITADLPQSPNIMEMVHGAVSAALRRNGNTNVTVLQLPPVFGQPGNAVTAGTEGSGATPPPTTESESATASASPSPPAAAPAAAAVIIEDLFNDEGYHGTGATTSEGAEPTAPPAEAAQRRNNANSGASGPSAGGSATATNNNNNANPENTNVRTNTRALGAVIAQMRTVQTRLEPFIQSFYELLQNDPDFPAEDQEGRANAQRLYDRVSEALHYLSHAQHAISDLMLDLSQQAPRFLTCRPILVEQSGYVSANHYVPAAAVAAAMRHPARQHHGAATMATAAGPARLLVRSNSDIGTTMPASAAVNVETGETAAETGAGLNDVSATVVVGGGMADGATAEATVAVGPATDGSETNSSVSSGADAASNASDLGANFDYANLSDTEFIDMENRMRRVIVDLLQFDGRVPPGAVPEAHAEAAAVAADPDASDEARAAAATAVAMALVRAEAAASSRATRAQRAPEAAAAPQERRSPDGQTQAKGPDAAAPSSGAATPPADASQAPAAAGCRARDSPTGEEPQTPIAAVATPTNESATPPDGNDGAAAADYASFPNISVRPLRNETEAGEQSRRNSSAGRNGSAATPNQARVNTATLPTTSTQTRSTSRQQLQIGGNWNNRLIPSSAVSSFDRFLPCNSHHIRETPLTREAARQDMQHFIRVIHHLLTRRYRFVRRRITAVGSTMMAPRTTTSNSGQPNRQPSAQRSSQPSGQRSGQAGPASTTPQQPQQPPMMIRNFMSNMPVQDVVAMIARGALRPTPGTATATTTNAAAPPTGRSVNIQTQLMNFVNQSLFENAEITPDNTERVVERAAVWLYDNMTFLPQYEKPEYDSRASVINVVRRMLPSFIAWVRHDTAPRVWELRIVQLADQFIKRLYSVLHVCVGRANAEMYWGQLKRILWVPAQSNFGTESLAFISNYLNQALPPNMDTTDAEQFLVHRIDNTPAAVGSASNQREQPDVQMIDLTSELTPPSDVTDPQEPLPIVVNGSEPWHSHLPSDWLPVITRDINAQRAHPPTQEPFSDAYISGMSAKRRKIVQSNKPPTDLKLLMANNVRKAIQKVGASATTASNQSLTSEEVTSAIATDNSVQTSYLEAIRASARERSTRDRDYQPHKFPQLTKFLKK